MGWWILLLVPLVIVLIAPLLLLLDRSGLLSGLPWRGERVDELLRGVEAFAGALEGGAVEARREGAALDTLEIKGQLEGRELLVYSIFQKSSSEYKLPARYSTRWELKLKAPGTLERLVVERPDGLVSKLISKLFGSSIKSGHPELDRRFSFRIRGELGVGVAIETLEDAVQREGVAGALLDLARELGLGRVTLEDDTVKVSTSIESAPELLGRASLERIFANLAQIAEAFERPLS